MRRRHPRSTRTDTLFPYPTLFRPLSAALRHPAVLDAADAVLAGETGLVAADFSLPVPDGRSFSLRVVALPAAREDMAAVLALHDVTALRRAERSEEHTSEIQSLMRISYAVLCLKKKKHM